MTNKALLIAEADFAKAFLTFCQQPEHWLWLPVATGVNADTMPLPLATMPECSVLPGLTAIPNDVDLAVIAFTDYQPALDGSLSTARLLSYVEALIGINPDTVILLSMAVPPGFIAALNSRLTKPAVLLMGVTPVLNGAVTADTDKMPPVTITFAGSEYLLQSVQQRVVSLLVQPGVNILVSDLTTLELCLLQQQLCVITQSRAGLKLALQLSEKQNRVVNDQLTAKNQRIGDLKQQRESLLQQIKAINVERNTLNSLNQSVQVELSQQLANTTSQLEAFTAIQQFLHFDKVPVRFHHWPISPDLGLKLIELILQRQPRVVIEFGSGTSTVLMAKALSYSQRFISQSATALPLLSIEHDQFYLAQTARNLALQGLSEWVNLSHCPLIVWQGDTAKRYYDCAAMLAEFAIRAGEAKGLVMALVDGPPGRTNAMARYPALPMLMDAFAGHKLLLLVDDANRADEQQMLALWQAYALEQGWQYHCKQHPLEKGLAIVELERHSVSAMGKE